MKIDAIRKDVQKKLRKSIDEIADRAEVIMHDEIASFYFGGSPSFYNRTGTLATTPQITDKYCTKDSAAVTASLNQNISYDTGTFSGAEVIDAAEYGRAGIVGHSGFWERSEERIKETVDDVLSTNF